MTKACQQLRNWQAEIAIILGSGLNSIVQQPIESIDFTEFSELQGRAFPDTPVSFRSARCRVSV